MKGFLIRTAVEDFPEILKKMSDREIARKTGLDAESVSRMRKGQHIRTSMQVKMTRFARTIQDKRR
jgi:hypothetical protein